MGRIWDTARAHFSTEDERNALSYQNRKQEKLAKTEHETISLALGLQLLLLPLLNHILSNQALG